MVENTPGAAEAREPIAFRTLTEPEVGKVSKREMLKDLRTAMVALAQTESRRRTAERFIMAMLLKHGDMTICEADMKAAAGYMLKRTQQVAGFLTKADPTAFVYSVEKIPVGMEPINPAIVETSNADI